ncbi:PLASMODESMATA CALLOSE-BINDING PROTEIN 5-like [Mercurialis annua]|uniref:PLASMODESMATA CALLOSE-BINDING PROTEIN 5-like n=1 Tax=Mercurialis annua TaxID=3986 RepID=UPI00215E7ED2|nr:PLASMODESMATA CALLOSE-BINDING PROTEIN 5-like [Mercurialis annua]
MCFNTLVLLLTIFSFPLTSISQKQNGGVAPRDLWCVAKNNADDQSLQAAIDWACGPGGANCNPIQNGGPCYDLNDIQITASWAFNDYYLRNGLSDDACFFSNTAALTSLNPSHNGCKFPSSLSVNKGMNSNSTTTTTTSMGMGTDSADLSGSSPIAGTWYWPIITCNLFVILGIIIGV